MSERVKREVSSIKISGTTKLVGVMGWPISHTLSPQMHNSAFAKMKLDYVYVPLPVAPDRIDSAIHALRAFNMVGANVTIPHKESVVPFMDKLSDAANLVGAVNTIINRNGKLFGHTTDPEGICGALRKAGKKFRNQRVVIMGSGGSARTALFTALMNGANKVTLVARSIDKARKVLSEAKKKFTGSVVMANETDSQMAADAIANATLLINSTPLGMGVLSGKTPVDKKYLNKSLTVFDMVYAPAVTRLLKDAHSVGAKTVQGIDMLVYQGMASFELWTGKRASYTLFRQGTGL